MALTFCAGLAGLSWTAPALADEVEYTPAQVMAGSRLYAAQCTLCHGPNGDLIPGINLSRQQFRTVISDDDIAKMITTGNPKGMPPGNYKQEELDSLVAFIRAGLDSGGVVVKLGDPVKGKAVYAREGCVSCHRIDGVGPRVAPDLSDIGYLRRPGPIQTSLLEPNKATQPINRPITIVTNDGRTLKGRRYNEDTFQVQLIDSQENMLTIPKTDIRQYEVSKVTTMPSYQGKLNGTDLADLMAYLVSLKRH